MLPIAFDTETWLIEPGLLAPPLVCISTDDGETQDLTHHRDALPRVVELLECDRPIVGHNVAYDLGVLSAWQPALMPLIFAKLDRGLIHDTKIRERIFDIAAGELGKRRYNLDALAQRRPGMALDKSGDSWRLRYRELHDVPIADWPEAAATYAMDDATATLDVWAHQEIHHSGLLEDEPNQVRAAWWLHLMAMHGLVVDAGAVAAFEQRVRSQYAAAESRLVKSGLVRADGSRDTKKAMDIADRVPGWPQTKGGKPSLSADACQDCGIQALVDYSDFSTLMPQLKNNLPVLLSGLEAPINVRYEVLQATGRTSSSNPNIQNLPRQGDMRRCFIPRDGWLYAGADYDQFELHTFAQVCIDLFGASDMADALNAGKDPHLITAAQYLGIDYSEIWGLRHEPQMRAARQLAKVANFGYPGGMGAGTLVVAARKQGVAMTLQQAQDLKRSWFASYGEAKGYFAHVSRGIERPLLQPRTRRFRGGCNFPQAANTNFQGLAADAAKRAGWLLAKACYVHRESVLFGSRPVVFVHDEFITEVRDDELASERAIEQARIMVEGANAYLPDVPCKAGPYLMRRWEKNAEAQYNEQGDLVPWTA